MAKLQDILNGWGNELKDKLGTSAKEHGKNVMFGFSQKAKTS